MAGSLETRPLTASAAETPNTLGKKTQPPTNTKEMAEALTNNKIQPKRPKIGLEAALAKRRDFRGSMTLGMKNCLGTQPFPGRWVVGAAGPTVLGWGGDRERGDGSSPRILQLHIASQELWGQGGW